MRAWSRIGLSEEALSESLVISEEGLMGMGLVGMLNRGLGVDVGTGVVVGWEVWYMRGELRGRRVRESCAQN